MPKCYLCEESITELNKTREHIIPNAIGGKLKSSEIICANCNITCGLELDHAISLAGNPFASKLNIKRERNPIPTLTAIVKGTQEEIFVDPSWVARPKNPSFGEKEGIFSISAGSRKRVLQELERIKKQLAQEGRTVEVQTGPTRNVGQGGQIITFTTSINKDILMRAVSKIIASFYVYKTNDTEHVLKLGNFIRNGGSNQYTWLLQLGFAQQFFKNSPYHSICIIGDKAQNILYGYFELFGTMGFISVLNEDYQGEDKKISYVFDAVLANEVDWQLQFNVSREQLLEFIRVKPNSQSTL